MACAVDVLDAIVDEERARRIGVVLLQDVEESVGIGFAQADLAAVVRAVEELFEVGDAILACDDRFESGHVDGVGIAQQQYLVTFLQPVYELDAIGRNRAEHGVPVGIDVGIGQRGIQHLADAIAELCGRKCAGLEAVEQVVLLGLAVEAFEVGVA